MAIRALQTQLAVAFAFVVGAVLAALASGCGSADTVSAGPPDVECPKLVEDATLPVEDPPDGPAACAPGDCNYQTQAGCSDELACRPQFNATDPDVHPGCESFGSGRSGEACKAQRDCARGFYCAEGACHKLCCGADWSACDENESCYRSLDVRAGGKVIAAGVGLCFPTNDCDPLTGDGCSAADGRECKIVDPTGAAACAPLSNAKLGDACEPPDVCQRGLACVGGVCIKLCAFAQCGEPACEPDEGSCVHFARDPEGVGECTLGR